jgi:hypothetical protein
MVKRPWCWAEVCPLPSRKYRSPVKLATKEWNSAGAKTMTWMAASQPIFDHDGAGGTKLVVRALPADEENFQVSLSEVPRLIAPPKTG